MLLNGFIKYITECPWENAITRGIDVPKTDVEANIFHTPDRQPGRLDVTSHTYFALPHPAMLQARSLFKERISHLWAPGILSALTAAALIML